MPRRKISPQIQAQVVTQCLRRCCLCYGINGDLEEKRGQIAHLDRNSANAAAENLVFLCLEHHDDYDSRRSQSKGYLAAEVKIFRGLLWEAIKLEKHLEERPIRKQASGSMDSTHAAKSVERRVSVSPAAGMFTAWKEVEEAAMECVNRLVQRDRSSTPMDIGMVIALITRLGVVSESVSSELHILWHRRNHVAHGMSAEPTMADAQDFRRRADRIVGALASA